MPEINEILSKYKKNNELIEEEIDKLLLNDDVRNFIYNNDLSHEAVENGISILNNYILDTYVNADGLKESKSMPGFCMNLGYDGDRIVYTIDRVKPLSKSITNIKSYAVPKEQLDASFNDFSLTTDERRNAYTKARVFVNAFGTKDQEKGLYLCGKFRCGKTYLASAIAKAVAEKDKKVIMVYYPELSSILKGSMNGDSDESFQQIVTELKETDLLILDDFGGEACNPFIRDEALGVILQYRMVKKKPVIFTSNIATSRLADTSLRKDNSENEKIKAQRIVERIKELTEEILLTEKYIELDEDSIF